MCVFLVVVHPHHVPGHTIHSFVEDGWGLVPSWSPRRVFPQWKHLVTTIESASDYYWFSGSACSCYVGLLLAVECLSVIAVC